MQTNEFYTIGYIRRVIGLKGEMGIKLDVDDPNRYNGIKKLELEKDGQHSVINLVQAKVRNGELVIRTASITTPEAAKKLVGSTVVLPLAQLPDLGDKRFYFHEVPGFKVIDNVHGELGVMKEVMERIMQPVLVIKQGFTEILIPLLPDTILKVDRVQKELHVQSPPGLVDIYLEKSDEEE